MSRRRTDKRGDGAPWEVRCCDGSSLLVFVAGLSGTVGLWVGLFYAPAPGEDTRQKLSTFFSENEGTFDDLFARSRQALGDAIDAVSGTLKAEGESEPDK